MSFCQFFGYDKCPFWNTFGPSYYCGTLVMVDIYFKMRLALDMVYILVRMHLALHVPFKTLIITYILVRMHLAFHVPFGTLAMNYIIVKMHLALHFPFRTLVMAYIPFKTCLTLTMVNILTMMHCAHNNILDVFIEPHTKVHYAFQITENSFHYNPMWLFKINHKLVHNPHRMCNIRFCAYHCIHEIFNCVLKQNSLHCFQVYITLRTYIFWKLAIGYKGSSYWFTFNHSKLLQHTSNVLALVQIDRSILLNMIDLYP